MTRLFRLSLFTVAAIPLLAGCAGPQDYRILPADRAPELLAHHRVVVEGHLVGQPVCTYHPPLIQYILFWVPWGDTPAYHRCTAHIAVDRVLKGSVDTSEIVLSNYLPPAAKANPFPKGVRGFGLVNGSVVRLGFDAHRGSRFQNLTIVTIALPGQSPTADIDTSPPSHSIPQ